MLAAVDPRHAYVFVMDHALVSLASFAVLGYYGFEIFRQAPPIPWTSFSTG